MITHYPILQNWLRESLQDMEPITPECLVMHATANPGAGDEAHVKWLNSARQHGWANYYLDHNSIRQVVPEGWRAPAQGPTYNRKALSVEMCEPAISLPWTEQVRRFNETWDRAVWLAAWTCHRYGWGVDKVRSHADVSVELPNETDHTDPHGFLNRYGRTWGQFTDAVMAILSRLNGALPEAQEWQTAFVDRLMQTGLITERRHPMQPLTWWEAGALFGRVLDQVDDLKRRMAELEAGRR